MNKGWKKMMAAAIACVSFAGCSKEEETAATASPVITQEKYIIAMASSIEPFEYTDSIGNFIGIDIDLLTAIADDQGFKIQINSIGYDEAVQACKSGNADGMISAIAINDEKAAEGYIFSDSYYSATESLVVPSTSEITSLNDLKEKSVAVITGSKAEEYAESLKTRYGFTTVTYEDRESMYQAMTWGQVSGIFDDTAAIQSKLNAEDVDEEAGEVASMYIVEGSESEAEDYAFVVFSEDKQGLIDLFNAGLAGIKEDGTYNTIISSYLGEDALPEETPMPTDDPVETEETIKD